MSCGTPVASTITSGGASAAIVAMSDVWYVASRSRTSSGLGRPDTVEHVDLEPPLDAEQRREQADRARARHERALRLEYARLPMRSRCS
jgi:hypothetical protein